MRNDCILPIHGIAHASAYSTKVVDVEAMFNADISRAVKQVFEETSAESNVIEEVITL